jgi:hypothetical protein
MTEWALVGCGSTKRDCRNCRAYRLYTSAYFRKKRAFAEWCCDEWSVLSAKWGLFAKNAWISPYDVTISDYPLTDDNAEFRTLEQWGEAVADGIEQKAAYFRGHPDHEPLKTVHVLAGQDYIDPLRDFLETIEAHDPDLSFEFPFEKTSGIGEQQQWLSERVAAERGKEPEYLDHLFCDHCGGAARDARRYEKARGNPQTHGSLICRSCLRTHHGLDETTIDSLEPIEA